MQDGDAIQVTSLSKRYQLFDSSFDRVKEIFSPFRTKYHHEFSALEDITFSVKRGEFFGIIGRNGSGKSTLLQLICGIMAATGGTVETRGRVSALLELGAGFNPEFTGKENIHLTAAILGFSQRQLASMMADVIAFADIGDFVDQPVKTYSSGMYVRLAFAIQTCVDPDILVVDEALAVGDVFFRQKCHQRLQQLLDGGCTVLLVSHSMGDIEQLCDRVLVLDGGRNAYLGSPSEAVKRYYLLHQPPAHLVSGVDPPIESIMQEALPTGLSWPGEDAYVDLSRIRQVTNGWASCDTVAVCNGAGVACRAFHQGDTLRVFFEFSILHPIDAPTGGVEIVNDKAIIVHGKTTMEHDTPVPVGVAGGSKLRFRQDIVLNVAPGEYTFNLGLAAYRRDDWERRGQMPHEELDACMLRVCILSGVAAFSVSMRSQGQPVQLMHHGIADLPGGAAVHLVQDDMVLPESEDE